MTKESNLILNNKQVLQKISRMAYEIYENNYLEKELVLAGIPDTGYILADLLSRELQKIAPMKVHLLKLEIDKEDPASSEIIIDFDLKKLKKGTLILVDDVLHTGKTFVYSLKPFLEADVKKIETAVLVDRSYKSFPISADYTGYELSTTMDEHIHVALNKEETGVYIY